MDEVRMHHPNLFPGFKMQPQSLVHKPIQDYFSNPWFNQSSSLMIPNVGSFSLKYCKIRTVNINVKPTYKFCEPGYKKIWVVANAFKVSGDILRSESNQKFCDDTRPVYRTSADNGCIQSFREVIIRLTCSRNRFSAALSLCRDQPCKIIDFFPKANTHTCSTMAYCGLTTKSSSDPLSITVEQPNDNSVIWCFRDRRKASGFLWRFFRSDHCNDSTGLGNGIDKHARGEDDLGFNNYYKHAKEYNNHRLHGHMNILPLQFPLMVTLESDQDTVDFHAEIDAVRCGISMVGGQFGSVVGLQ
ncbi:hypothetical protein BJ165DRAFT_696969 [Panaeolus papilionaceus]|nr:hypothetical protein BJ165DRAFT_696969 [Panaeolus papilionaceus]